MTSEILYLTFMHRRILAQAVRSPRKKVSHETMLRSLFRDGIAHSLRSRAVAVPEIWVTRQGGIRVRVIWIIGDRPIDSTFRFQRAHTV